ncbi:hypothetical protein ACE939_08615 [Aquimarina sp. W85]|uniref:hypothetical protein n=1 Tax=Aquimarina rhodophyticola TaxID=3342246 RepID=UPI0036708B5C
MKTIIVILVSFTLNTLIAQTPYDEGMKKAFELWKSNNVDKAANLFERIAKAENKEWLPYYYAAQINIIDAYQIGDAEMIEARLTKAQEFLNAAKSITKDNAELLVLEAMLNTAYVVYDSAKYGMTHSPKVEALYQQAKKIDSLNPRAIINHAEWKMGAAKYFGKDPKIYCAEVDRAIPLFKKSTNTDPYYPTWGLNQISRIQKNCRE